MTTSTLDDIANSIRTRDGADPYRWIRDVTDAHRAQHWCWAYPYQDGSILGAVVDALRPDRVLEFGTALGYTACWWAARGAQVATVELDPAHVRLARVNIERASPAGVITVHAGDFGTVVPTLTAGYDLAFFDGYAPPPDLLTALSSCLRPDGLLVATNLDLGDGQFRSLLSSDSGWETVLVEDLALARRR